MSAATDTPIDRVTSALAAAGRRVKGSSAQCPAHDDKRESLSLGTGDDGRALVTCHAGCQSEDVVTALGLTMADLFPERSGNGERSRITATYDYRDEQGDLLFQVVRFDPKGFRQRRPEGDGWAWNLNGTRRVLYNLPALSGAEAVYIVEGEKDADTLTAHGLVATTNPGGAGAWRDEYAQSFAVDHVAILPDADDPGRAHAYDVAKSLHGVAASVRVVELPGLPPKGDVTTWLADGNGIDELRALVRAAPAWTPDQLPPTSTEGDQGSPLVLTKLADVTSERVRWLWRNRIPRGKLVILDGDPGRGKSTLLLDLAARFTTGSPMPDGETRPEPVNVVLMTAEDGLADTVRPRFDAAGGDPSRLTVVEGRRDDEGRPLPLAIPDDIDLLERAITETGAEAALIDPLVAYLAADINSHRDQDVRRAMHALKDVAERTGAVIVVVRHLNKSGSTNALYRGGGSIGIIGAARLGLLVAPDPDDESRSVLAVSKSNLGPVPPLLVYRVVEHPDLGVGCTSWEGTTERQVSDLLVNEDDEQRTARQEAREWLAEVLSLGPLPRNQLATAAKRAGFSESTLNRAKRDLGVASSKVGFGSEAEWRWSLPTTLAAVPTPEAQEPDPACSAPRCARVMERFDPSGKPWCQKHYPEPEQARLTLVGESTSGVTP